MRTECCRSLLEICLAISYDTSVLCKSISIYPGFARLWPVPETEGGVVLVVDAMPHRTHALDLFLFVTIFSLFACASHNSEWIGVPLSLRLVLLIDRSPRPKQNKKIYKTAR